MKNEITLEQVVELYEFLKGEKLPGAITIAKESMPNLNPEIAMTVIWFLQEHFRILPDHYEQCANCLELYDSYCEGHFHR